MLNQIASRLILGKILVGRGNSALIPKLTVTIHFGSIVTYRVGRASCYGIFFCYSLPALDTKTNEFTLDAGSTRWYFFDMNQDQILEDPGEIIESIRS